MRIARIPYLNTEPFYRTFRAGGYELLELPPRRLGEEAEKGGVVAGPMSAVDYFRLADEFEPLGPYGIACAGPVRSVLLFSKKPAQELHGAVIAVTEETSTSVRLLELLLRDWWEVSPAAFRSGLDEPADAQLLIGDAALRRLGERSRGGAGEWPYVIDLSQAWYEWQQQPFVFALWAVKKSLPLEEKKVLLMKFEDSLYEGLKEIPAIAAERSADLMLPPEELESYLRHFRYRLGPEDWAGLDAFRRMVEDEARTRG